ncbi:hypothetical protein IMZ48_18840 [Candidatus Bathyarchaeota archaeon]|nr:hypothetical protein [Candidatus Bathyarchaeota archaeon]
MIKLTTALSLLPSLASVVSGYADPGECSGVCVNAHDPAIIVRDDGTYFRFSTGGNIAVHTAPALIGPWTFSGAALPDGSSIYKPGNQDLWVSSRPWFSRAYCANFLHAGPRGHPSGRRVFLILFGERV